MLLTAAGQVGERLARAREEERRQAQAASEQRTQELRSRLEAERRTDVASLGTVYRPEWWDTASAEQISGAYAAARAWAGEDPKALRAEQHVRQEVRARYSVDLDAGHPPGGGAHGRASGSGRGSPSRVHRDCAADVAGGRLGP